MLLCDYVIDFCSYGPVSSYSYKDAFAPWCSGFYNSSSFSDRERQALAELRSLCNMLKDYGEAVRVDFSVGNDMKYYSGVVFRGYLEGIPVSVLSGGQYDKLLRKMGRSSSAIGFSVSVDLLEQPAEAPDVDTVVLHGKNADPAKLVKAAEAAAKQGTVLVTTELPEGRNYRNVIRLEEDAQ